MPRKLTVKSEESENQLISVRRDTWREIKIKASKNNYKTYVLFLEDIFKKSSRAWKEFLTSK